MKRKPGELNDPQCLARRLQFLSRTSIFPKRGSSSAFEVGGTSIDLKEIIASRREAGLLG